MVMISLTYAARRLRLATAVSQGWCVVLSLPMQPSCQNANAQASVPEMRIVGEVAYGQDHSRPDGVHSGRTRSTVTYGSVSLFIAFFVLGPMVGIVDVADEGGGGKASREPRSERSVIVPTTVWRRRE